MKLKGWFRLWVVLTVVGVPLAASADFQQKQHFWGGLNKIIINDCVDAEAASPAHPDAIECGKRQGTFQTVYQRENITPGTYWPQQLGFAFIEDLMATAVLSALFLVGRWVWRGFRPRAL